MTKLTCYPAEIFVSEQDEWKYLLNFQQTISVNLWLTSSWDNGKYFQLMAMTNESLISDLNHYADSGLKEIFFRKL